MKYEPASHRLVLDAAYAACRAIAKREAKNFYYAFVALPAPRRNAICAVYAFMRQADDLADDESLSIDERCKRLDAWLADWRGVCHGGDSSNPVFQAVRDAVERFDIPLSLLDELVAGVTMDLKPEGGGGFNPGLDPERHTPGAKAHVDSKPLAARLKSWPDTEPGFSAACFAPDTYATFDDLYRYCYLVASVVGLVCIRIFGYSDPGAEKLAEETGIAFQLTNILRDVAEDAQRNRVYLPLEDLAAHGVSLDSILHRASGAPPTGNERALLAEIAARAEGYYRSAQSLLPLIDRESRPALWVLVSIYHALLKRIQSADYDVFSRRASVPMAQKLAILAVGIMRMGWARLFA